MWVMYLFTCAWVHVGTHACGGLSLMKIFCCFLPYILRQGLLLEPKLSDSPSTAGHFAPGCPSFPLLYTGITMPSWYLCGCWGSELRSAHLYGKYFILWVMPSASGSGFHMTHTWTLIQDHWRMFTQLEPRAKWEIQALPGINSLLLTVVFSLVLVSCN